MEFGGQASQTAAPVPDLYVPAVHTVHDVPSIRFSRKGSSFSSNRSRRTGRHDSRHKCFYIVAISAFYKTECTRELTI